MITFNFPKLLGLSLAGLCPLFSGCEEKDKKTSESEEPNIIFIMVDDMGYGDAECYNPDSKIPTPHINSLADEGMQFTNAHAPGSWSIPTRYGLLTGRYPDGARSYVPLEENQITIADLLNDNGYHTGMVGKWHLGFENDDNRDYSQPLRGGPIDHGFEYYFGIPWSLDISPYFYIENDTCVQPPTDSIEANHSKGYYPIQGEFWRPGKIAPDFNHQQVLPIFTNKAVSFIEAHHQNSEKPFFLYFALAAPHTPWLPTGPFKDSSQAGMYGDFTAQVDHSVGRVLNVLEKLGLEENTLVFFTSDNGPVWYERDRKRFNHKSTHYLRGMKGDAYEGGHRMPFLARWPGQIEPGTKTGELTCFTDMLATFADLIGDTLSFRLQKQSSSILPLLLGNEYKSPINEEIIVQDRVVIQGKWKFIEGEGHGGLSTRYKDDPSIEDIEGELYNLAKDSTESNNLYSKYPDRVEYMRSVLQSYRNLRMIK